MKWFKYCGLFDERFRLGLCRVFKGVCVVKYCRSTDILLLDNDLSLNQNFSI